MPEGRREEILKAIADALGPPGTRKSRPGGVSGNVPEGPMVERFPGPGLYNWYRRAGANENRLGYSVGSEPDLEEALGQALGWTGEGDLYGFFSDLLSKGRRTRNEIRSGMDEGVAAQFFQQLLGRYFR